MRIQIEHQNHFFTAEAQMIKGKLWIHFNGKTWCLEDEKKKFGKSGPGKSTSNQIHAPMPGKITKILRQIGDKINAGEAVVVMEAMKMEYTLKSEISGAIKSLSCQLGEQVILGKALVVIEPSNES